MVARVIAPDRSRSYVAVSSMEFAAFAKDLASPGETVSPDTPSKLTQGTPEPLISQLMTGQPRPSLPLEPVRMLHCAGARNQKARAA